MRLRSLVEIRASQKWNSNQNRKPNVCLNQVFVSSHIHSQSYEHAHMIKVNAFQLGWTKRTTIFNNNEKNQRVFVLRCPVFFFSRLFSQPNFSLLRFDHYYHFFVPFPKCSFFNFDSDSIDVQKRMTLQMKIFIFDIRWTDQNGILTSKSGRDLDFRHASDNNNGMLTYTHSTYFEWDTKKSDFFLRSVRLCHMCAICGESVRAHKYTIMENETFYGLFFNWRFIQDAC